MKQEDVLVELGQPEEIYYKPEDKLAAAMSQPIVSTDFSVLSLDGRSHPGVHSKRSSINANGTRERDYYYNYYNLGLDILFSGKSHRIVKFLFHTNLPGLGRSDFGRYIKATVNVVQAEKQRGFEEIARTFNQESAPKLTDFIGWNERMRVVVDNSAAAASNGVHVNGHKEETANGTGKKATGTGKAKKTDEAHSNGKSNGVVPSSLPYFPLPGLSSPIYSFSSDSHWPAVSGAVSQHYCNGADLDPLIHHPSLVNPDPEYASYLYACPSVGLVAEVGHSGGVAQIQIINTIIEKEGDWI